MKFLADVGGIGRGASLEGVRRVRAVMPLTDAWKVGAETSVACFGDLGVKASIVEKGDLEVGASLVGVGDLGAGVPTE